MNIKQWVYGLLMVLLGVNQALFSMNAKKVVFYAAKGFGCAAVPSWILYNSCKAYKEYKNYSPNSPMPRLVEDFARNRMQELNFPGAQSVFVDTISYSSWGAMGGKGLVAGDDEVNQLNSALLLRELYRASLEDLSLCTILFHDAPQPDKIIARDGALLAHEVSHLFREDGKKALLINPLIAVATQGVFSSVSYGFNKLCGIGMPKTWLRVLLRSFCSVYAIGSKKFITSLGIVAYSRYCESLADKFSCENPQSREGLEEFQRYFKNIQDEVEKWADPLPVDFNQSSSNKRRWFRFVDFARDPHHPYPGDRVDAIQQYIDKWDEDHPY